MKLNASVTNLNVRGLLMPPLPRRRDKNTEYIHLTG
jgi:hypothetical protein